MTVKNYHFIAIGGAVMHQLALHLLNSGHHITGSDDAIFNPAYNNLSQHGILPNKMGWFPERIHSDLDAVILGMHAQKDNPELLKAQQLGVKIYSFPEFIYEHSKDKKRIVIAGSHGKTTTTSMIMHVLKSLGKDFDYLVGAQIEGFDYVVKTSNDAPFIIIEGDEYLTSPLDLRSKFLHYHPHIAVVTGIAWDHINVFPTFSEYIETFRKFFHLVKDKIFFYYQDEELKKLAREEGVQDIFPYYPLDTQLKNNMVSVVYQNQEFPIQIFGEHNMANMSAALHVCQELGVSSEDFFKQIYSFKGAAKRLELLYDNPNSNITIYKDFAHAPSKVRATVEAIRCRYPERKLILALELHTYSSLQKDFIIQYKNSLNLGNHACVYIDNEALKLKKKDAIEADWLKEQFGREDLYIPSSPEDIQVWIQNQIQNNTVILLMSSGHWGGLELKNLYSSIN
ncbi:MAG: Mur ligase domain-containing protein [Chitinophagales bacterium]|nr:Mur ligase domain-containing protein [Chitinophagales bacterium]